MDFELSLKDLGEEAAKYALDEISYKGLTIREWADFISNNTDDLISRYEAISSAYWHGDDATWDNPYPDGAEAVDVADLEALPSILTEQKFGQWRFEEGDGETCVDGWVCTACKKGFHTHVPYFADFKYCPNCGIKMRECVNNE